VPEIIEIELYRRSLGGIVGRQVAAVHAPDAWYLKHGVEAGELRAALVGRVVVDVRRRGKLLLVDLADDAGSVADVVLGLRFGMTGRPILDGGLAPLTLEYSSGRDDRIWDRFALDFTDGGQLRINDPRRLGGVELEPDEGRLGPDAFTITRAELRRALQSRAPLKAVLLDQQRIAGIGNMIADECCWRAGIDPARPAGSLTDAEVARLHRALRAALAAMLAAGGSHRGRLEVGLRVRGAVCPKDGTPLQRRTIGGRTTYSCPGHQR
jgi:formamidopyrimidine-DNA glycosylase